MEPETNPVSPTSQPTPASAPEAPVQSPTSISETPVSVAPPEIAPIAQPEAAPVPPSAPAEPTTVPPVPPAGTFVSTAAPSSGSGKSMAVTFLVLSLLAGGAAAGYYYWMNMRSVPVAASQTTEAATSTESSLTTTVDPTLRPALEGVILSLNAALATSSYEAFLQTIDAGSASQITKADFEKSKDVFKKSMLVDLAKIDFVDLKTDNSNAGYYFLWPTTASSTTKTLGMVAFVKEATGWKIAKLFNKDISLTADVQQTIGTDPDFSFSAPVMPTTTGTTTISGKVTN